MVRPDDVLTEGDFDLVNALFPALGNGRRPAGDHVFLAQLADAFRVTLYLSLNFDPFLETALWEEGNAPNVIEVAKDSDLPSGEAVRDRLTVLKLHGGAYGAADRGADPGAPRRQHAFSAWSHPRRTPWSSSWGSRATSGG